MSNYDHAKIYVETLTGDINTIIDWRMIHDTDKGASAHTIRGTLDQVFPTLQEYNAKQYGIFAAINQLDGEGRELSNVQHIRSHVADLDDVFTSAASLQKATTDGISFSVESSPNKFHVYWTVEPYVGNDFYTHIQRKLIQLYNSDKSIIDATRVMRVPGFLHQKDVPFLTVMHKPTGSTYNSAFMQEKLEHVNMPVHISTRAPLGEPTMSAPSLEWLQYSLTLLDPNDLTYGEWVSFCAALKQSGWLHTDEAALYDIWSIWCEQYEGNDAGETRKIWDSIKDTEVGWTSIERRCPMIKAQMSFGHTSPDPAAIVVANAGTAAAAMANAMEAPTEFGEMLSEFECREYFKECFFIGKEGKIFTRGRFMNSTQFSGVYGGKIFIVDSLGKKITDDPWKAALRSTCWTIPKVDHVRFLPDKETFEIVEDCLGRKGLNTYIPANVSAKEGDVSLWLDHIKRILPDENDRKILMDYMAHCVKFPGYKIPWAPLLQSAEGIGKGVFIEIMQHCLGSTYVYSPKADQLAHSGSTFNAWMRCKLLIMVNEIKTDEKRSLIEKLKPMITDKEIEVQAKGVDQDMEDNLSNWFFFSNFKDAIPISINGRRYSIFYSILQSYQDILNAGMDDAYFKNLFDWLREGGGFEAVAHYFLNYPIERGQIPMRSPYTSSHEEALKLTRSPMEVIIDDCIADGIEGFKGGFVSDLAVLRECTPATMKTPNTTTIKLCLEGMGYVLLGRALEEYAKESIMKRPDIYSKISTMSVVDYAKAQGYPS